MINSLKTIAFFGCQVTSRYRKGLCRSFNQAAKELGVNIVYFNSLGKIGNKNAQYGDYEFDFLDYIDLNAFDGVIFDGEGYNVDSMKNTVIEKCLRAKCPVVSISSRVEGMYNIEFDEKGGLKLLIEHFIDHHGFTKIGFMSGYLTHPDAQARLAEFRSVMTAHGLPEDGIGMFEGDFWFHKGEEAADFFLSRPERPEAVVCANDYMAIALSTAFKRRGVRVPEDIAVSGFDGSLEGREFLPHITSVTRERNDIARKSLEMLIDLSNGRDISHEGGSCVIRPRPIFTQSCGCEALNYEYEAENINSIYEVNRQFSYNLYDTESIVLKLNKVDSVPALEGVFREQPINFGDYTHQVLMLHIDSDGRPSNDSDFTAPSGRFAPVIWIDNDGLMVKSDSPYDCSGLLPEIADENPHFLYLMSVHCAERMFGYSILEMADEDVFDEFYNVWLLNVSTTLERLFKNDRINKLIGTLENLSIRDGLTGLLNRRGFEELSRGALRTMSGRRVVCTMVIDMDGLKHINDEYGHYEGDCAIKAAANLITKCCSAGEIAGRAGGDEFYIFASEYSEEKAERFIKHFCELVECYNRSVNKPYKLELSYGTYVTETDRTARLEDLISVSDRRMYEQKLAKPNRRK